jgi:hypothetical protein
VVIENQIGDRAVAAATDRDGHPAPVWVTAVDVVEGSR